MVSRISSSVSPEAASSSVAGRGDSGAPGSLLPQRWFIVSSKLSGGIHNGSQHSTFFRCDAGYYAIGFRADGTAILGKPGVTVTAGLGFTGGGEEIQRRITGVNKARVSTGGIYLYTYDLVCPTAVRGAEPASRPEETAPFCTRE